MEPDLTQLPTPVTFANPLRQFAYDQRLSQRRLAKLLGVSLSQLPYLLADTPSVLSAVRVETLARIKDVTQVDLISWYITSRTTNQN